MQLLRCPACGAPVPPEATQCPYCQSYFRQEGAPSAAPNADFQGFTFERRAEPNEQAFTLAVPKGWLLEGGVIRAHHMQQVVNVQTIAAKVDFAVKRDAAGTVMIRWVPEVKYCDTRMSPAAMFFPQGSSYNGMVVWPLMSGADFLVRMVFPWAHTQAQQAEVLRQQAQPAMVEHFKREAAKLGGTAPFQYDGGEAVFRYTEGGVRYESTPSPALNSCTTDGGMWSNKNTVLLRAPAASSSAGNRCSNTSAPVLNRHGRPTNRPARSHYPRLHEHQQAEQARARRALEISASPAHGSGNRRHHRMTHAEIRDGYLLLTGRKSTSIHHQPR